MLWLGGLAWTGAVAGAGLALILLAFQYRASLNRLSPHTAHLPLGPLGDYLYPLLPPLAVTVWLGAWQVGIAYGAALPAGTFGGIPALDESGVTSLRFPLQPLAALTLLVFFWLLETRVKLTFSAGRLAGLAIAGLLLHTIAFSLLRADPAPYWSGLRVDTWLGMLYLIFFITLVTINTMIQRSQRKNPFSHPERSSS
jgi:prolipoprotein diacylglyceryltransferase